MIATASLSSPRTRADSSPVVGSREKAETLKFPESVLSLATTKCAFSASSTVN